MKKVYYVTVEHFMPNKFYSELQKLGNGAPVDLFLSVGFSGKIKTKF